MALSASGADAERDALLKAFEDAIGPYREGRYAESARRLSSLASERPDMPEVAFYLGMARLMSDEPAAALEPLRAARDSTILSDEARWYEAIVLERTGRPTDADAALRPLCDNPGLYSMTACLILRGDQ